MSRSVTELLGGALALYVVLFGAASLLVDPTSTSWISTWRAVADDAEPALWRVTVWHGATDRIAAAAGGLLFLADLAGSHAAEPLLTALLCALVLLWALGTVTTATALGAAPLAAWIAGAGVGFLVLGWIGSDPDALGAAPLVPLVASCLARGGNPLVLAATLLAGCLSRGAMFLALPFLIAGAMLARRGTVWFWAAAAVAGTFVWMAPDPDWVHAVVHEGRGPAGGGEDWTLPAGTAAFTGAAILGLMAMAGTWRAGAAASLPASIVGLAGLFVVGRVIPDLFHFTGIAPPMRLVELVLPGVKASVVGPVACLYGMAMASALAARGAGRGARSGILVVPVVLLLLGLPRGSTDPASHELPDEVAGKRALALPISLAGDLAWRRAEGPAGAIFNGTQELLSANAPVLAREIDPERPGTLGPWLDRLVVDHVLVPDHAAGGLGTVLDTKGGWSLVVSGVDPSREEPCLSLADANVTSNGENPDVDVPGRAIDGDLRTRWGTGGPQRPGHFLEIRLDQPRALGVLELELGAFRTDVPRGFRVLVARRGAWREVVLRDPYDGAPRWDGHRRFAFLDPRASPIVIELGGVRSDGVRVELTRGDETFDWSVAELCLRDAKSGREHRSESARRLYSKRRDG